RSAPAGKLFPTPKNSMVGAGIKKSVVTGKVTAELFVRLCVVVPEADKKFGGRALRKKNPLIPTPKNPLASATDEANGRVCPVGRLGKGIPGTESATTRTSARSRLWSGANLRSERVLSG